MNNKTLQLSLLSLFSLLGCGEQKNGEYPGEPLAHFEGQLFLGPSVSPPTSVSLALAWVDLEYKRVVPGFVTTQSVPITGGFPFQYSFSTFAPPPAEVLVENPDGTGKMAYGMLIAYLDKNGNGQLDTIPPGQGPIDEILGTPSTDFYVANDETFVDIWYVDGPWASGPAGLQQGYNLVKDSGTVVPLSTSLPITLNPHATLNLFVCQSLADFSDLAGQNACLGKGGLRVQGFIEYQNSPQSSVALTVWSDQGRHDDATVIVNGVTIPYDSVSQEYVRDGTSILWPGNDNIIVVERAGMSDLTLKVPLRPAFALTSPQDGAHFSRSAGIPLTWTTAAGTDRYTVSQQTSAGFFRSFRVQGETSFMLPPLPTEAASAADSASIWVRSRSTLRYDANGSNVSATSTSEQITVFLDP